MISEGKCNAIFERSGEALPEVRESAKLTANNKQGRDK
jgi:hypothetical protein